MLAIGSLTLLHRKGFVTSILTDVYRYNCVETVVNSVVKMIFNNFSFRWYTKFEMLISEEGKCFRMWKLRHIIKRRAFILIKLTILLRMRLNDINLWTFYSSVLRLQPQVKVQMFASKVGKYDVNFRNILILISH